MDKVNAQGWTHTINNTTIGDLVKAINELKPIVDLRIGIDPTLLKIKVKKFEMNGFSIPDMADKIAKECAVKAFFVRDFLYVAKALPPGVTPAGVPTKVAPNLSAMSIVFPGILPGSSKKISWLRKSPKDCALDLKPIALYVIGGDPKKENLASAPFDMLIFDDGAVVKALAEFTCIKVTVADPNGWPAALINLGKRDVALLLLTADLHVVNHWEEVNAQITPSSVAVAAAAVIKANQAVKDKLK
ncbi:MAG: hypothetical protein V1899_04880 [Planctomycetota bacterium]